MTRSVGVLSRSDSFMLTRATAPLHVPRRRPGERETLALGRMEEPALEAAREGSQAASQAAHLARNAVDCLPSGALAAKLAKGRPLRVKLGLDPTAPDIHLGHTVVLTKLREFQDAGHTVVLIVGDYTARVGDPVRALGHPAGALGRGDRRQRGDLRAPGGQGAAHRRAARGPPQRRVARHDAWTSSSALARHPTVAQLLERDDFARRFAANEPISLLELLYPVLQGYDSVCIDADVELGGTDQTFNLLMGRSLQSAYGQEPQVVLTMPLLTGLDGAQKMSKSLGNHIGVTDPPEEMYGRTMRIPDEQIAPWFSLLLGAEPPEGARARATRSAPSRARS